MTLHTFFLERVPTPTGPMLMVTDAADALRALEWEDHGHRLHTQLRRHYGARAVELRERRRHSPASRALEAYFAGKLDALDTLATATAGTDFHRAVWRELRRIPVGQTITYSALASRVGRASAIRAAGFANGSNPISIVVPCHRVIGADRSLTGYGGGLARKRWLLAHEGVTLGL